MKKIKDNKMNREEFVRAFGEERCACLEAICEHEGRSVLDFIYEFICDYTDGAFFEVIDNLCVEYGIVDYDEEDY